MYRECQVEEDHAALPLHYRCLTVTVAVTLPLQVEEDHAALAAGLADGALTLHIRREAMRTLHIRCLHPPLCTA